MMRYNSELKNLEAYYVKLSNEKSSRVINNTLEYYSRQAIFYKRLFLALSVLTIILNAGIPVMNQINASNKLVITLMSSVNLVIAGVLSLLSVKETWSRYREACEKLKIECNNFNAKACPYNSSNPRLNEILFLSTYEDITMAERKLWKMKGDMKNSNEAEESMEDGDIEQALNEIRQEDAERNEKNICVSQKQEKENIQL